MLSYTFSSLTQGISCGESVWQLRHYIGKTTSRAELLHPFYTLEDLYLSKENDPRIAPSLQELVGGSMAEVLPALQNIFLEELH
jgi:hypothetical protein